MFQLQDHSFEDFGELLFHVTQKSLLESDLPASTELEDSHPTIARITLDASKIVRLIYSVTSLKLLKDMSIENSSVWIHYG